MARARKLAIPKPASYGEDGQRRCDVTGCEKPHYGHGKCRSHYERWRRLGDAEAPKHVGGPKYTPAALEAEGLTRRRLHHWHALGHLKAPLHPTGNRRVWTGGELRIALLMSRLVDGGLTLDKAAEVARQVVTTGRASFSLGKGLSLKVAELDEHIRARPW